MAIQKLSFWDTVKYKLFGWAGFTLPVGELIGCYKDRTPLDSVLFKSDRVVNWATNEKQTATIDPGRVSDKGVGYGTPMQLGRSETREVTWGSGYGRYNQWLTTVPLPLDGNRYWVTGYPTLSFDKRCIIMGVDGQVHELIQFDQDAPIREAGLPQQALNRGRWKNGSLVDGVATTAADLPSHGYIWGRGSLENPHCQAVTTQDYLDGDGSEAFAEAYPDGPRCGDWFYLPRTSQSYIKMKALGGQCASRAEAMAVYGVRLIDRGGRSSVLTQAGTWARATNIHQFTINLGDLRLVL
jgi:hypothetical protein